MHSHITPSTFDATEYLIRALTGWRPKGKRSKQERKMDMRKYAGESFIRVDNVRNGSLQERIALVKEGKYERPDIVFESGDILTLNTTNARAWQRHRPDARHCRVSGQRAGKRRHPTNLAANERGGSTGGFRKDDGCRNE
jgi:hypothetical protein